MRTNDFITALSDIRSFAEEVRTEEMNMDATKAFAHLLRNGLRGELGTLSGQESRDEFARFFLFEDNEKNRFLSLVVDGAVDMCQHKADVNIRSVLATALHKSQYSNMHGVKTAITFFQEGLNGFRVAA